MLVSGSVRNWVGPALAGVLAALLSTIGLTRPSLWHDEYATISAATRSPGELMRLLGQVDAVHGVYYSFMHLWLEVFPLDALWLRLPSVLATGAGAAGMVVLGRLLRGPGFGYLAAALYAVLPRTTANAVEARQYALVAALGVWLTVLVVVAARRRVATDWWLYGFALAFTTVVFAFGALVAPAHFVTLLLLRRWNGAWRQALASAGAALAVAPFLLLAWSQRDQVSWIGGNDVPLYRRALINQYFPWGQVAAVAAALLILAAAAVWVARRDRVAAPTREPGAVTVGAPLVVVPSLLVLLARLAGHDFYLDRYLSATSAGAALVLAAAIATLGDAAGRRRTLVVIGLTGAFAAGCVPAFITQRGAYAKWGTDHQQVLHALETRSRAGDCVLFDTDSSWNPTAERIVVQWDPHALDGLQDPTHGIPAADANWLWDATAPTDPAMLATCPRIWFLSADGASYEGTAPESAVDDYAAAQALQAAHQAGFRETDVTVFNRSALALLER